MRRIASIRAIIANKQQKTAAAICSGVTSQEGDGHPEDDSHIVTATRNQLLELELLYIENGYFLNIVIPTKEESWLTY